MKKILENHLEELKELQEEMLEGGGDLEDQLEVSFEIDRLETLSKSDKKITFIECSLCRGEGRHTDYDEEWGCRACFGLGGTCQ